MIGGACAVGGAIFAPVAIPPALGGIGFIAAGVAAEPTAFIMAVVATAQSVGAAGLGAAGTVAAGAISGAAGLILADNDC